MTVLCLFDGIAGRTGGGWKREGIDKVPLFELTGTSQNEGA